MTTQNDNPWLRMRENDGRVDSVDPEELDKALDVIDQTLEEGKRKGGEAAAFEAVMFGVMKYAKGDKAKQLALNLRVMALFHVMREPELAGWVAAPRGSKDGKMHESVVFAAATVPLKLREEFAMPEFLKAVADHAKTIGETHAPFAH